MSPRSPANSPEDLSEVLKVPLQVSVVDVDEGIVKKGRCLVDDRVTFFEFGLKTI